MRLYLGGYLDFYDPQKRGWVEIELNHPTPLSEVLANKGIPESDIQLVVLNGELIDLDIAVVSNQDEVKLFSAVGGG
jgi:sulfur carrier protein ThiS